MTHTEARELTLIDAAEMARIRIGEHIRKKAEKNRAEKGRLRRLISFLFSCEPVNPYNLPADINVRLYL